MRIAVLNGPEPFTLEETAVPTIRSDEVRVRVEVCGVCQSDVQGKLTLGQTPGYAVEGLSDRLQPALRHWRVYPLPATPSGHAPTPQRVYMGHEVSGVIDAVGEDVRGFRPGDRVVALNDGRGYADYVAVPAQHVLRLPDRVPFIHALGEPLACAVNGARRAGMQIGDTVVLVGAGFMGALLLQLLVHHCVARVIVVDVRQDSLQLAAQLGADLCLNSTETDVLAEVEQLTGGMGADVVIEATGSQAGLDVATTLTTTRGRLVIFGYHQAPARQVNMQLWNLRGLDVVVAHERDPEVTMQGMRIGIHLLELDKLTLQPLVTHQFPLRDIDAAFAISAKKPSGFVKAVITPPAG